MKYLKEILELLKTILRFPIWDFQNDDEISLLPEIMNIQSTFDNTIEYINNELFQQ